MRPWHPVWKVSGSGPYCQSGYRRGVYEALTSECVRSVVQVLVVRVGIVVVIYEAMTPGPGSQSGYRSGDL